MEIIPPIAFIAQKTIKEILALLFLFWSPIATKKEKKVRNTKKIPKEIIIYSGGSCPPKVGASLIKSGLKKVINAIVNEKIVAK